MKPHTLVVCYTLTGRTRQVAEAIAAACGADLELIGDMVPRDTGPGRFRSAFEGLLGLRSAITTRSYHPGEYDLVVVGTPVWAARLSSPVRAYLSREQAALDRVAFFATQSGIGGRWALHDMAKIVGQQPAASMVISTLEMDSPTLKEKISRFVRDAAVLQRGNQGSNLAAL